MGLAEGAGVNRARLRDYVALLKPRVMSLVIFTALVGLVMAPQPLPPLVAAAALLCIAVGSGAAGALNMWYDADIDALMTRTARRPVPAGRVRPREALVLGLGLSFVAVAALAVVANLVAAGFLAFTIFFYAVIYTVWLKRATPQNIVIGGAAGAFPPMIGWSAVTGTIFDGAPIILFLIIFIWTPPHFWSLSLYRAQDYARAGIPMLPVVAGERKTRQHILVYSILLAPVAVSPFVLGMAGWLYGLVAVVLSTLFVALAWRVYVEPGDQPAKRLFAFSILYLFLLYAVLLAEYGFGIGKA